MDDLELNMLKRQWNQARLETIPTYHELIDLFLSVQEKYGYNAMLEIMAKQPTCADFAQYKCDWEHNNKCIGCMVERIKQIEKELTENDS